MLDGLCRASVTAEKQGHPGHATHPGQGRAVLLNVQSSAVAYLTTDLFENDPDLLIIPPHDELQVFLFSVFHFFPQASLFPLTLSLQ